MELKQRPRDAIGWTRIALWGPFFLLTTLLPGLWLRIGVVEAFEIDGPSMEPTLGQGDRLLLDKTQVGLWLFDEQQAFITWGEPELGDLVILNSPADRADIVKRVVGVGGDTIEVRSGRLYRNGEAITSETNEPCSAAMRAIDDDCVLRREELNGVTYSVAAGELDQDMHDAPPVEIPPGHVYVLGDWRDHSNDSRNALIGPVAVEHVKGSVLFVYYGGQGDSE